MRPIARPLDELWRVLYRLRILHALGIARTAYWRHLRPRHAYARRIRRGELRWSGKRISDAEVAELVEELKRRR